MVLILLGLSLFSLYSGAAHRWLTHFRCTHPRIAEKVGTWQHSLIQLFDLSTHQTEQHRIPGENGRSLAATVEVSRTRSGVAIVLHSASGTKEADVPDLLARMLRARGFTVVRFDAYDGLGEGADTYRHFTASSFLKDLASVLHWAKTQPWWQEPLVLAGHSIGGLVAATYAAEHPDAVAELVLIAPNISGGSYEETLATRDPALLASWQHTGVRSVQQPHTSDTLQLGFSFVEDMRTYDLESKATCYTMPVYVLVGTHDTIAPLAYARTFVKHVGSNATLISLPHVPHIPKTKRALNTLRAALQGITYPQHDSH